MNNNTNKSDKVYVDGIWLKNRQFPDGGSILKVSIKVDKFIEFLNSNKKTDGFVNFDIKARREAKENGETHYGVLDTFSPKISPTQPVAKTAAKASKKVAPTVDEDDVAF